MPPLLRGWKLLASLPSVKVINDLRHCLVLADLLALCHHYISSNVPLFLRNLLSSTSHSFPCSFLRSPWILCFFLLSLHWGQSCGQCFIAVISGMWMDVSSGSAPLLCRLPCYYCGFLCVVRSAVLSRCHSPCVLLRHSRILCCLPTIGVAVSSSSIYRQLFFHISLFQSYY